MDYKERYEQWCLDPHISDADKRELLALKDNPVELEDRFYKELSFGTAGLRGLLGLDSNRMNVYNIARVTQGLADFINGFGADAAARGVAIAYDSRHYSREFAETAAAVLSGNGVRVYLYTSLCSTPQLSFTVRHYRTQAGIVITASHNPREYNGYKVYWSDGAQIVDAIAKPLMQAIKKVDDLVLVRKQDLASAALDGLFVMLAEESDDLYYQQVMNMALREDVDKDVRVVYSPLHGAGNIPVREVLRRLGYKQIEVVPEQEHADGDFPTVAYPNPEDSEAFSLALAQGQRQNADILIATDPDCDRLAAMIRDKDGQYVALNGNQTGALLIHYLLAALQESGRLPENGAIIKSIVTGTMGTAIAADYGVAMLDVLTGFKHICAKIAELESSGAHTYLFGYEESIGYSAGNYVRDKDGVLGAMWLVEMAAYHKRHGKSLLDVLEELFRRHGYYREKLISLTRKGSSGQEQIKAMMQGMRNDHPRSYAGHDLVQTEDYLSGRGADLRNGKTIDLDMPASDVLRFTFADQSWYALRPSGTEPKIKLYLYTRAADAPTAEAALQALETTVTDALNQFA
jgi:phosphoglucomutase